MFPTRQDAAYGVIALPVLLLTGISIAHAAITNDVWSSALACFGCCIVFTLILGYFRSTKNGSPTPRHRLLLDAHEQVARLTGAGYDMLVPHEEHRETARLLICMEGENAVIKKETWHGVWHFYTISPDGGMKREIWEISGEMTPADQEWLNSPLTPTRLQGLVTALRSTYTPRQRVPIAP
jgi:hypothetical protein